MNGRVALFWTLLIAFVGFGLFHVKYKVQALEDELAGLNHDIVREQEQLHVLRAEWAHLNRPQRLEELNRRYLGLVPLAPARSGAVAGLPMRPAPDAPVAAAATGDAR